jgi:hypothetical protein
MNLIPGIPMLGGFQRQQMVEVLYTLCSGEMCRQMPQTVAVIQVSHSRIVYSWEPSV